LVVGVGFASPFIASPFIASPFIASPFIASPFIASPFMASPFIESGVAVGVVEQEVRVVDRMIPAMRAKAFQFFVELILANTVVNFMGYSRSIIDRYNVFKRTECDSIITVSRI
jgi:hypothetical protein